MADTVMQILTWAIPSGGIGAAISWIANRKVKTAESAKKIHDTYKEMYEDISRADGMEMDIDFDLFCDLLGPEDMAKWNAMMSEANQEAEKKARRR